MEKLLLLNLALTLSVVQHSYGENVAPIITSPIGNVVIDDTNPPAALLGVNINLSPEAIAAFPRQPVTALPINLQTEIQYNPFTNNPIMTLAMAKAIFPKQTEEWFRTNFAYLFKPFGLNIVSGLPIDANTQLSVDPVTGLKYDRTTGAAITSLSQAQQIFPDYTSLDLNTNFAYLFRNNPTAKTPVTQYPINVNTGLLWNPATGVQYNSATLTPLTTEAQVRAIFANITEAQLNAFFSNLFMTTTVPPSTTKSPVVFPTLRLINKELIDLFGQFFAKDSWNYWTNAFFGKLVK